MHSWPLDPSCPPPISLLSPPILSLSCQVFRRHGLSLDDLSRAGAVERGSLSREVEYAKTTSALYAVVLREAQGVKGDVVALSGAVEALAGGISGARLVAARLAEVE